jgi:hypothetical protein
MARPSVNISQSNGNLGRIAPLEDGISAIVVSGVAVSGQFALNDVLGPFFSLADAENVGITEAYDSTNTTVAHKHIKDFYDAAGNGTELYVMVVAKTLAMADVCDKTLDYLSKLLRTAQGKVRLVAVCRTPQTGYTPMYANQLDTDIVSAITKAQELFEDEFLKHRPVQILIEARDFQGNISSMLDLRDPALGPNANRVSLVISQDADYAANNAFASKMAFAGYVLGKLAGIPVQRNIGRVKSGAIGITNIALSNGVNYNTLTDTQINTLHDKGYIFALKHSGKAGFFFNDDPTACPITDDYAFIGRGRVMDKASRITRQVFLNELNDDVELNEETGKLDAAVIKSYQQKVEDEINRQMTSRREIVRVSCFVDPDQNVLSTDKIDTEVNILPKGYAKEINSVLAYENPLA